MVRNLPAILETQDTQFDHWVGKIPLQEGMATHSSILVRKILGT